MNQSSQVIVSHAPKEYPHQEGLTCGEYNVRAILDGFEIPYQPPSSLRLRIRMFGYSFIQDISDLLQFHGVPAPMRYAAQLSDEEKIRILRKHIKGNQPVLLAIGNGHLRRGVYSPVARFFIGHFVTIYGYCNKDDIFFVYDPYLVGPYHENIPIGNEVRTFKEIIRDWRGPFYYKFIRMNHVYIPAGATE